MATLKDVMELAETQGHISADSISKTFDLDLMKACDVLKACWDKGLLLPVDVAWFAPPVDGEPMKYTREHSIANKEKWYRDELDALRGAFEEDEALALTVTDAAKLLKMNPNKIRKVLKLMEELGELVSAESEFGGAFGHKPIIFSANVDNFQAREEDLAIQVRHNKELRKARAIAKKKGLVLDTATGEMTEAHSPTGLDYD